MQEIIIEPGRPIAHYWRDIWQYRELFWFLAWRDVLLRYKRMTIGFAWAVIRPFLTMVIFTFIFGRLAKLPSSGIPYSVLVYTAMLPWQFFATTLTDAGNSLVNKETIITKVYFPRLIVPVSAVIVSLVDFIAAGAVLVLLLVWHRFLPDLRILLLPIFILLVVMVSLGAGLWVSALSVQFKDFRYVTPFLVQMGLYLSPVGFDSALIPETWRLVYALNPMVGVIEGFRWSLLGVEAVDLGASVALSGLVTGVLLTTGIWYFRRIERRLAELL